METKKIRCEFDKMVVNVLSYIVSDQQMMLNDGEGNVWKSKAYSQNDMTITIITKNDDVVAKIIYDHDTGKEESFLQ